MVALTTSSDSPPRRTQAARRGATRTALLDAARALFLEKGFAETGTPEIVAAAGLTRGALHHQFADKRDLFHAVAAREAQVISAAIDDATTDAVDAQTALKTGTLAYFDAIAIHGSSELLLVQAPAVLGREAATALLRDVGSAELRSGLGALHPAMAPNDLDALTDILSAAFDRAALAIANGAPRLPYERMVVMLIGSTTPKLMSEQRNDQTDIDVG
ncbi:putative transcriptional regulator, TetR family [Leifsonia rubra CMS 76R]|nr:putative transcriptional regulator, TetR family [Leifsonia rubra CMS 76R]